MCLSRLLPCGRDQTDTMKNESCSASGFVSYRKVARDFFFLRTQIRYHFRLKSSKGSLLPKVQKIQAPEQDCEAPSHLHFYPAPRPAPHSPTVLQAKPALVAAASLPSPRESQASAPRGPRLGGSGPRSAPRGCSGRGPPSKIKPGSAQH